MLAIALDGFITENDINIDDRTRARVYQAIEFVATKATSLAENQMMNAINGVDVTTVSMDALRRAACGVEASALLGALQHFTFDQMHSQLNYSSKNPNAIEKQRKRAGELCSVKFVV